MNRLILVSLAGVSMLALAACGESEKKTETPPATSEQPAAPAAPAPAPAEPAPAAPAAPAETRPHPQRLQSRLRLLLQKPRPHPQRQQRSRRLLKRPPIRQRPLRRRWTR